MTTGDADKLEPPKKNHGAQALGRAGGLASAKTRNKRLSSTKRKASLKKRLKRDGLNLNSLESLDCLLTAMSDLTYHERRVAPG